MADSPSDITSILKNASRGDRPAAESLLPIVYGELRRLASRYLRAQRVGHTLQPTALVHEAYLRLVNQERAGPTDRTHFIGLAAHAMRSILVDHARGREAAKRGGGRQRIPLDDAVALFESRITDLLGLDEALERLAQIDEQQCRMVELRFFGGLTTAETAEALGVSTRTVEREWRMAKAWLRQQVRPEPSDE
jgi:RNA polymerase sigma-70 factor (ECF subfamily)